MEKAKIEDEKDANFTFLFKNIFIFFPHVFFWEYNHFTMLH